MGCQDIHSHECGEYALLELQQGRSAEDVVALLLERYLVRTTYQRVVAYRYYREQRSEYLTLEKLEHEHWSVLYEHVTLDASLVCYKGNNRMTKPRRMKLQAIRTELCAAMRIAEELVPMHVLCTFYVGHEANVQLRLRYGGATVVEDALPPGVVQAYRAAWGGEPIADATQDYIRHRGRVFQEKSEIVAQQA